MTKYTPEQIEYLTICVSRLKKLSGIIFNEPFNQYPANVRFGILKDLYSVYSEIYSMKIFEEVHNDKNQLLIEFSQFQKNLYKMIRNALFHFPFFDNWGEVWIRRDLVLLNLTTQKNGIYNSAIEKFFNNYAGKQYAVRVTEYGGNKTILRISVPMGYNNNDKIFLKDIIEERNVGMYSVGYMRIIVNNFLVTSGLKNLVIPLIEEN